MRQILSILLTLSVVGLLIFTSTADALTIGISSAVEETSPGETIGFEALVDIHRDDLLLEDINLTLTLTNEEGEQNYTCTFDLQGNELTSCDDIEVALLSQNAIPDAGDAEVTGYNGTGTQTIEYGSGQGYGYAPGVGYDDFTNDLGDTAEFLYAVNWTAPNTADETDYTMSLEAHLDGESIFTTEENQETVTVVVDDDNDGVANNVDLCPATELDDEVPTQELGVNRYALLSGTTDNGYIVFDTVEKQKGDSVQVLSEFTTEDTQGCSCGQLLENTPGNQKGLEKFGCTQGILKG